MTTTSSLAGSKSLGSSLNSQARQNLFVKIQHLETCLLKVKSDLYRLEEQAKSVRQEKTNVQNFLQERAQQTKGRLVSELKSFQNQVRALISRSKKQTQKIDEKINLLKNGQLNTMQMILSLQRRVREVEVQLGSS